MNVEELHVLITIFYLNKNTVSIHQNIPLLIFKLCPVKSQCNVDESNTSIHISFCFK